jgi:hypothetical protein
MRVPEICHMANYQEFCEYFQSLCEQNNLIAHTDVRKKFFRMSMEEFLSGTHSSLPGFDYGPAFIFINYMTTLDTKPTLIEGKQLMFYILQGFPSGNYEKEMEARNNCELAVMQFISRMIHDSQNNHPIFTRGFDKADKVRIIPEQISATANYVGCQVVIYFGHPSQLCFTPSEWTANA